MSWILTVIIIIVVSYIAITMKESEEEYYILKIIGYYLLATFRLSLNSLHLPLGFLIWLIFLKNPPLNKKPKTFVALVGLAMFLLSLAFM